MGYDIVYLLKCSNETRYLTHNNEEGYSRGSSGNKAGKSFKYESGFLKANV